MNLTDLRRLCIRRQLRVTFTDRTGERCCINEHGATLRRGVAGWLQSEEDFAQARRFEVAEAGATTPRAVDREGLERLSLDVGQFKVKKPTGTRRVSLIQSQH